MTYFREGLSVAFGVELLVAWNELLVELLLVLLVVVWEESIKVDVVEIFWRLVEDFHKAAEPFRALNENLVAIWLRSYMKLVNVLGGDESIIPLLVYNQFLGEILCTQCFLTSVLTMLNSAYDKRSSWFMILYLRR